MLLQDILSLKNISMDIDVSEDLKGIDPPKHLFNYVSDFEGDCMNFGSRQT